MSNTKKTIDDAEYAEYRKRLTDISDLTDPKKLAEELPGRSKYDCETLRPKPFPGISLIHNIEKSKAEELKLSQKVKKFKGDLAEFNITNKVAFVSLDSFHATTFDLINQGEHGEDLANKKYDYATVRDAVKKETLNFVDKIGPRLLATARIKGIGMFAKPAVVKLNLTFNEVVAEVFQTYRTKLDQHLIDNVDGYLVVRKAGWNNRLSAHITIGYVVNPMDEKEIDGFLRVMCEFNNEFEELPFDLTQGEVTRFTDMDNYFVDHS